MKRVCLLVMALLTGFVSFAQEKNNYLAKADIKDLFWKNTVPIKEVPANWQKEDAVLLHKTISYELLEPKIFKSLTNIYQYHYLIQVQNADGVKRFSELEIDIPVADSDRYYGVTTKEVYVAARVIKPKGKIVEVGEDHIVHIEAKTSRDKQEKLKIAVPQLEVGDVLDYFIYYKLPEYGYYESFSTGAIEFILSDKYPVLFQQINVHLQPNSNFDFLAYNGAPGFNQVKKEKKESVYSLTDVNREANKEERWRLDNKELPTVKFKVRYLTHKGSRKDKGYHDLAQHTSGAVLDQYLLEYLNSKRISVEYTKGGKVFQRFLAILSFQETFTRFEEKEVADLKKWIRRSQKVSSDPVEVARMAYEANRVEETGHRYEYEYLFNENGSFDYGFKDMYSAITLSRALKLRNIPHEVIFTYAKSQNQSISIKPNVQEINTFIKVSNGRESIYLGAYEALTVAGEYHPAFEGAETRVFEVPASGRKVRKVVKGTMPERTGDYHFINTSVEASFDEEHERMVLNRTVEAGGNLKHHLQRNMIIGYNYLDHARIKELGIVPFAEYSRKQRKELAQTKEDIREKDQKRLHEWYELELKEEFASEQLKLEELVLQQPGIWSKAPSLKYKDKLTVEGFAAKAGPDYLIEVGKLIGEQVKLSEEEKTDLRQSAIYFEHQRAYNDEIILTVPDGYIVNGLESLNADVNNTAGQFVVKAEQISANQVKISVKKLYKASQLPKEAWGDVIAFTEAANKFYNQQLLMKKADMSRN